MSPCCLLIGQYPHHMTLCPPVAIVKRCYKPCLTKIQKMPLLYLFSKVVQLEESRSTLYLSLNECGRGHLEERGRASFIGKQEARQLIVQCGG